MTSKELEIEMQEHSKHEYNMLELIEHVEYIDFIGIDKILYSYVPLISILKALLVDQEFMMFYASMTNFLS